MWSTMGPCGSITDDDGALLTGIFVYVNETLPLTRPQTPHEPIKNNFLANRSETIVSISVSRSPKHTRLQVNLLGY